MQDQPRAVMGFGLSFKRQSLRFRFVILPLTALGVSLAAVPVAAQLRVQDAQVISQDMVGGLVEQGDHFGGSLAAGDFNGDGYDDLAIGVPNEDVGTIVDAGAVVIAYGSVSGLNRGDDAAIFLHQDAGTVTDTAEAGDFFGAAIAAGDFNHDGYAELVVGVPGEDLTYAPPGVGTAVDAGAIHVFAGLPGGLSPNDEQFYQGDSFPGTWATEYGHRFGAALATSRLASNIYDDLLIGIPGGPLAPSFGGTVMLIWGTSTGLDTPGAGVFLPSDRDGGDLFGAAVAIGVMQSNSNSLDMIFGAPDANLSGASSEGGVWNEIAGTGYVTFGGLQTGAHLGSAVAMGDFRGSGYQEALYGEPGFDTSSQNEAGRVVLYDHPLFSTTYLSQGSGYLSESPEPLDHFGEVLAVGDFDADGYDDAAFGVPGENLYDGETYELVDAGTVQVLYGSTTGLGGGGSQLWTLDEPGLIGALANDQLGGALATGDFNGDGVGDLAIGAPGAVWSDATNTGIVVILYGRDAAYIFGSNFEGGTASGWSAIVP